MERVLGQIPRNRCVVCLDDLLAHAADFQGALQNLQDVFETFGHAGLPLNPKKCQLLRKEVSFLGHIVSREGVSTDPAKVTAVQE